MSLANGIRQLYPEAINLTDFRVSDYHDGKGPFIVEWNEEKLGPQPSSAALKQASDQFKAALDADKAAETSETSGLFSLTELDIDTDPKNALKIMLRALKRMKRDTA